MDVTEYLRILHRRRLSALSGLLLALAAAVGWGLYQPASYTSSQTLFLVQSAQDSGAPDALLNSYAALIGNFGVVDAVRRDLGRTESTDELARRLAATVQANTLILTVTATDTTAAGAQGLAAAASRELAAVASTMNARSTAAASRLVAADTAAPGVATGRLGQTLALGLLLGLLLGFAAALLREAADRRIRGADQLDRLGLPTEAVVEIRHPRGTGPEADVPPGVRVLRAALLRDVPRSVTAVVVCGCDSRHAGQDVFVPLGVTLARSGLDVVLVRSDLRPPGQAGADPAPDDPGLSEVLVDGTPVQSLVRPGPLPSLWVLPRGRGVARSEDVLACAAMSDAVAELRASHDLVLFQVPPLDTRTDALAVAGSAPGAVILLTVVRGRTTRAQVRAALATLAVAGLSVAAVALVPPRRRNRRTAQRHGGRTTDADRLVPLTPLAPPAHAPRVIDLTAVETATGTGPTGPANGSTARAPAPGTTPAGESTPTGESQETGESPVTTASATPGGPDR